MCKCNIHMYVYIYHIFPNSGVVAGGGEYRGRRLKSPPIQSVHFRIRTRPASSIYTYIYIYLNIYRYTYIYMCMYIYKIFALTAGWWQVEWSIEADGVSLEYLLRLLSQGLRYSPVLPSVLISLSQQNVDLDFHLHYRRPWLLLARPPQSSSSSLLLPTQVVEGP